MAKTKKSTKKQKAAIKKTKEITQIDSDNLRVIIKAKLKYAVDEKERGYKQIATINTQIERLNGIILFCNDLIKPLKIEK